MTEKIQLKPSAGGRNDTLRRRVSAVGGPFRAHPLLPVSTVPWPEAYEHTLVDQTDDFTANTLDKGSALMASILEPFTSSAGTPSSPIPKLLARWDTASLARVSTDNAFGGIKK